MKHVVFNQLIISSDLFGLRIFKQKGVNMNPSLSTFPDLENSAILFKPFLPGENFSLREPWKRPAIPKFKSVDIAAPARIHFSLFDYTKMKPPRPGGGGVGISTSVFKTKINISVDDSRKRNNNLPPSTRHIVLLFEKLAAYNKDNVHIRITSEVPYSHHGYGSNVALNTSIFYGLNVLFGKPFSERDIYDILTHNYVENTDDQQVHWGFDTGVGEACLLFGGFVLIDEHGKFIGNIEVGEFYALMAKGNMSNIALTDYLKRGLAMKGETGLVEAKINEEVGMVHQKQYGDQIKQFLRTELEPIFVNNSKDELFAKIWKLNDIGTFKRMQMSYRPDVMLDFEARSKAAGAIYSGISSAGPSMFALFGEKAKADGLIKNLPENLSLYFDHYRVDHAGEKIETATVN